MGEKDKAKEKKGKKVKVKKSSAGLGLFADEPIKRDEFVIEYTGENISSDEADERGGKYLFEISKTRVLDGKSRKNTARYINHSCRPNCDTEVTKGHVYVYARRNIEKGEELSYNYGKEYFNDHIKPHGCKCAHCLSEKET